jgi:hypothetical protein
MLDKFRDRAPELTLPHRNHPVEALLLNRTNRSAYAFAFGACAKLFVALAGITSDDAPQLGVSFERRRIDTERFSLHQTGSAQALQHPCKHRPMGFEIDQSTRSGDGRVIGRRAFQPDAEKITQCQRVRRTQSNAALRVDALRSSQSTTAGSRSLAADWVGPSVQHRKGTHRASAKSSNPCSRSS